VDLLVLAVPLAARPAALARIGAAIGPRTTVVLPARGPLGADAELPERYVRERTRAAAIASIGVPAGAGALLDDGGVVELRCTDPHRGRQLAEVLERAGLRVGAGTIDAPAIRRVA
jgi:hypothetical protein